jgi:hypothetical protein
MWTKILELLLGKALDRFGREKTPRERLARAFTVLFESMTACHQAYLAFRADTAICLLTWQHSPADDEFQAREKFWRSVEAAGKEWLRAIIVVARALDGLRVVLDVREPELLTKLDSYIDGESLAFYAARGEQTPIAYIAGAIGRSLPGSSVADPEAFTALQERDRADFESAISKLRDFMRNDLRLSGEELLGGQEAV